jgi:hypothetical protein
MAGARLKASEREFFAALNRVIYGNPFSDEQPSLAEMGTVGVAGGRRVADEAEASRLPPGEPEGTCLGPLAEGRNSSPSRRVT